MVKKMFNMTDDGVYINELRDEKQEFKVIYMIFIICYVGKKDVSSEIIKYCLSVTPSLLGLI